MTDEELIAALSLERFSRYLAWAGGDRARALELYALNTRLSEALYTPLQMLEVALRNRIHTVMTEAAGERWFDQAGALLIEVQKEQLTKAYEDLARERKDPVPGRVVAALTFSFWTSMLSPAYDERWRQTLHRVAQSADGKGLRRKDFSSPLAPIRTLRNRVAHHEPIIDWNLPKHYGKMLQLTGWLFPAAAAWCREHSRFDEVHPAGRIAIEVVPKPARAPHPGDPGTS